MRPRHRHLSAWSLYNFRQVGVSGVSVYTCWWWLLVLSPVLNCLFFYSRVFYRSAHLKHMTSNVKRQSNSSASGR